MSDNAKMLIHAIIAASIKLAENKKREQALDEDCEWYYEHEPSETEIREQEHNKCSQLFKEHENYYKSLGIWI